MLPPPPGAQQWGSGSPALVITFANDSLDLVSIFAYHWGLTASELKRWLRKRGCSFEEGSKHTKVML
jgi:hypothetical protein